MPPSATIRCGTIGRGTGGGDAAGGAGTAGAALVSGESATGLGPAGAPAEGAGRADRPRRAEWPARRADARDRHSSDAARRRIARSAPSSAPFVFRPRSSTCAWIAAPSATTSSGLTLSAGGFAEEVLHSTLDQRHARGPADQDDAIDVRHVEVHRLDGEAAHLERAVDHRLGLALELVARHRERDRDGLAPLAQPDVVDLDGRFGLRGEALLQPLGVDAEARELGHVDARVEAVRADNLVGHDVGDDEVDVVAAERRVAGGGEDLEDVARQIEERDVERAAAEVVDGEALVLVRRLPVGERRPRSARSGCAAPRAPRACPRPSSTRAAGR